MNINKLSDEEVIEKLSKYGIKVINKSALMLEFIGGVDDNGFNNFKYIEIDIREALETVLIRDKFSKNIFN